ncbi:MAG: tRNA pseudouridine(13) synthase TruD [Planctomycetota bacterium]
MEWLTRDLPGTGGAMRERLEDFVVEEIPLYEPVGVGEHLYVTIQKVGISTHEAVRRVARALGVPERSIGYAGLKDARAIAIQTLSVAGVPDDPVIEDDAVSLVAAKRHGNKLRPGHLRGNRFHIRVRGTVDDGPDRARAILDDLTERGVPNRFGPQRFGSKGDADLVGRGLIRGDPEAAVDALLFTPGPIEETGRVAEARELGRAGDLEGARRAFPASYRAERQVLEVLIRGGDAERALRRVPKPVRKIHLSAYQSRLFNRLVDDRLATLGTLEEGDLAYLHDRGAVFTVEDAAAEQARADAFEISPSGPLFGRKVKLAEGEPGERERALLETEGLDLRAFGASGIRLSGERRPFRVPLGEARVRPDGDGAIMVSFALPRGSFATAVMAEVMK